MGERIGVLVPGLFEQAFRAEGAGAGFQQRFQDRELLGGELERSPVTGGAASERVEFDPAAVSVRSWAVGLRRASAGLAGRARGK